MPELEGAAHRSLFVRWNEKMDFDGLQAKFFGLVESKMGQGKVKCEEMTVQLVSRMSFVTQGESSDAQSSLKTIRCQENVNFEYSTYEHNRVVSFYRGTVGELLMDHTTGLLEALGPGKVRIWQQKIQEGASPATEDTIQANRPIPVEVTVWDFTKIEFEGQLKGRFDVKNSPRTSSRKITVVDRVEVIHGPVSSPNETVNPDKLPAMGGSLRCERLEVVNHPKSKNSPAYSVLVGKGNTEVEGRVDTKVEGRMTAEYFTASGDRISYDQSKGLFMLQANGTRKAIISGMFNFSSQGFEFNPKLKTFKLTGATDGRASQ